MSQREHFLAQRHEMVNCEDRHIECCGPQTHHVGGAGTIVAREPVVGLACWPITQPVKFRKEALMFLLLLIVVLVLLFGGGGGYYGYRRWGTGGGVGIVGLVVIILLFLYLFGGIRL